jgi:uncharacterized repeat protein (TIGR01451 family)
LKKLIIALGLVSILLFAWVVPVSANYDYSLKWYAADPALNSGPYHPTYLKKSPNQLPAPVAGKSGGVGRLNGNSVLADAVAYGPSFSSSHLDAVTSLMPEHMALGQIVPFELEIKATGTLPLDGVITFTADWRTKTTSGGDFGFDPSYMVYAAFVDTSDIGTVDPGNDAKIDWFSSIIVNTGENKEAIEGTFQISGLDTGDNIIVEIWMVLQSTANNANGNVHTYLVDASTGPISSPGSKINVGTQTVPLMGGDFDIPDVSIIKSESPDPINLSQGNTLTYTIKVTNNSANNVAGGVVVTDTLDSNTSFVSTSALHYNQSGNTLTFTLGNINPIETISFNVIVTVDNNSILQNDISSNPEPGSFTVPTLFEIKNKAVVSTSTIDSDSINNIYYQPTNIEPPTGVPTPELPAAALFGLGLAGIGAFIVIRKRRSTASAR